MKRVLAFRHVPHEGLGTIGSFLISRRFSIDYYDLFSHSRIPTDLDAYELIVSMGGPMNADETDRYPFLQEERKALKKAIGLNKRVLGVCLGSQLIARALDARVYSGSQKEIGWFPIRLSSAGKKDPVFKDLSEQLTVFHWHGDTFDLPKDAVCLASSDLYQNQAFKFGEHVYAFQFHVEITGPMIVKWIQEGEEELKQAKKLPESIASDNQKYMPSLQQIADKIYANLLDH